MNPNTTLTIQQIKKYSQKYGEDYPFSHISYRVVGSFTSLEIGIGPTLD